MQGLLVYLFLVMLTMSHGTAVAYPGQWHGGFNESYMGNPSDKQGTQPPAGETEEAEASDRQASNTDEEEKDRKADLDAQQRMANAAEEMNRIGTLQLYATGAEALLLLLTLAATSWAAYAAGAAAAASKDAVKIADDTFHLTRENARTELRAYLTQSNKLLGEWR
jgi:hypothetical protein